MLKLVLCVMAGGCQRAKPGEGLWVHKSENINAVNRNTKLPIGKWGETISTLTVIDDDASCRGLIHTGPLRAAKLHDPNWNTRGGKTCILQVKFVSH